MISVFGVNISSHIVEFLHDILKNLNDSSSANKKIEEEFGIVRFFDEEEDYYIFKDIVEQRVEDRDKIEYGDFQTNYLLAQKSVQLLVKKNASPEVVIEPTCGQGNYLIAALEAFENIQYAYGIEIYKPYVWETKFNIIRFYLQNPRKHKPQINISHCNVFDFDFEHISEKHLEKEFLVIGNPPWVTNSKLGTLSSTNLPRKSNFKNHKGIEAITGKGNFDIAEFISLLMIRFFEDKKGYFLWLVKNSVIKNIIFDQRKNKKRISSCEKWVIDSKKEFKVTVAASIFICRFNSNPAFFAEEFDFYNPLKPSIRFGWADDKFVSNLDTYLATREVDGESPLVWRQGLKHDCTKVMELDKSGNHYQNKLDEVFELENDLVYSLLKSSDLKKKVITSSRKYTIVTQKKVGQNTEYIKSYYPKTFKYLQNHLSHFQARKSVIYKNKPDYSIFGIGEYSFKPYKVAISGLYKTFHFSLVLPNEDKPVMLDDTCYMIGFDRLEFAVYAFLLLNSHQTESFLKSITFDDAKRIFTKDILMRIDLFKMAQNTDKDIFSSELKDFERSFNLKVSMDHFSSFISEIQPTHSETLFS